MAQGDGIKSCEDAFERLLEGKPHTKEFVGLPLNKITANIVSQEAGFGPGYLKSSRHSHKPLVARIESNKVESSKSGEGGLRERLRRATNKASAASDSESNMKLTLNNVLTQNLMLVERVRQLEEELRSRKNVSDHPTRNA